MGSGVPTGPRGGFVDPNPAVQSIPRHSRWIILAHLCAFSDPTLLWAAKGVPFPHVGVTETHRARKLPIASVAPSRHPNKGDEGHI